MNRDEEIRIEQLEEQERQKTMKIKATHKKVAAYCMMWGDEDTKDLSGEYFTRDTEVGNLGQPVPIRYYNSGEFINIGTAKVVKDDVGIYAVGELEPDINDPQQSEYVEAIESMLNQRQLSFSMATQAGFDDIIERNQYQANETGEIKYWPILSVIITPTPSDPR